MRRKWQPTPVLLPGKSHGRKSVVGYSSWGRKELDTTEQLHYYDFRAVLGIVNSGGLVTKSEKAMAPHSSTLAWKILWMEEPGRLQSMGLLRVRHD